MPIIYTFGIKIYYLLVRILSLFNKKAKKWVEGRKNWREKFHDVKGSEKIWFHFASLGEFEQGKPLLKAVKEKLPQKEVIITFFSPSGYEIRKNSPLGDHILYLPLDTPKNARDFVQIFRPEMAIFNKYEYWYYFFKELDQQQIPLYVTSAIFRENQIFFKWYGGFNRKILNYVSRFFVQNEVSAALLQSIGISNFTLSGDTRFDSVADLAAHKKDLPLVDSFKANNHLLVAGSTWPEDEKLLCSYLKNIKKGWKFIFAPHEISEAKLLELEKMIGAGAVRYSELADDPSVVKTAKVLIIDNIGMLSSLYAYGDISYIGGGFGTGIHNTLEAAAWGLPVIFGPNYQKFQEAKDLVALKGGFAINSKEGLKLTLDTLITDEAFCRKCGTIAKNYVEAHIGATEIIMKKMFSV